MNDSKEYYTIRETAERLNVNPRTVNRWVHRGTIMAVKLPGRAGGEFRIPTQEVDRLLGKAMDEDADMMAELREQRNFYRDLLIAVWRSQQDRSIYVAGRGHEVYLDTKLSAMIRDAVETL